MQRVTRSPVWFLVAILGGLYLAHDLGAKQVLSPSGLVVTPATFPIRLHYIPNPNDIVNLKEGTPYTVPAGKVLIITDWAVNDDNSDEHAIYVDGTKVWAGFFKVYNAATTSGGGVSAKSLRIGVRANAGQTVELVANNAAVMFASGYLATAQ